MIDDITKRKKIDKKVSLVYSSLTGKGTHSAR